MANTQTTNPYDPEVMRTRFWQIQDEIAAIDGELAPLRDEHDAIANYKRDREIEINTAIKDRNQQRYELQTEAGRLASALGGRTGEAADQPYDAEAVSRFHAENPTPQEPSAEMQQANA